MTPVAESIQVTSSTLGVCLNKFKCKCDSFKKPPLLPFSAQTWWHPVQPCCYLFSYFSSMTPHCLIITSDHPSLNNLFLHWASGLFLKLWMSPQSRMNSVSRKNNLLWNYSRFTQKLDIFILNCTSSVFPDIQNAFFMIFLKILGHFWCLGI